MSNIYTDTLQDIAEGGVIGAIGGGIVGGFAGGPVGALVGAMLGGAASAGATRLVDKREHDGAELQRAGTADRWINDFPNPYSEAALREAARRREAMPPPPINVYLHHAVVVEPTDTVATASLDGPFATGHMGSLGEDPQQPTTLAELEDSHSEIVPPWAQ